MCSDRDSDGAALPVETHIADVDSRKPLEPWFSVVISTYNRAGVIERCVRSCIDQSFRNIEVVVVDDASNDATGEVLEAIKDERVRVIHHTRNRGLCAARDTGARSASGKWIITFDSDHALLPGALDNLFSRTRSVAEDVGVVGSCYRWDTGQVTPAFVPDGVIDYAGRIRWVDREGGTDYLCCYRRRLYGQVTWPANSRKGDQLFQLDLAMKTKEKIDPDIIAIQCSEDRNSESRHRGAVGVRNMIRDSRHWLWQEEEVLKRHGKAIAQHGAGTFALMRRKAALFHFVVGHRKAGFLHIIRYLSLKPFSPAGWAILLFGLLHGKLLAFIHVYSRNLNKVNTHRNTMIEIQ